MELTIYNYKSHTFRSVSVTPSRNWPGEGFLGVIIRFDTFHDADEYMCHVLDVEANSPAELAGLQPDTDYLLGTTDLVFKDSDVLFDVLNANIDKPFEIYVFNSETDEVRIAVLMPTTEWVSTHTNQSNQDCQNSQISFLLGWTWHTWSICSLRLFAHPPSQCL